MSNQTTITVKEYNGPNRTPAYELVLRANLELVQEGYSEYVFNVGWDNQVLVAFVGDYPVGVLVYSKEDYAKRWFINLGYVAPPLRNKGVYKALWNKLVELAAAAGTVQIDGITHIDNAPMRAVAEKQGRVETGVLLSFKLPSKA